MEGKDVEVVKEDVVEEGVAREEEEEEEEEEEGEEEEEEDGGSWLPLPKTVTGFFSGITADPVEEDISASAVAFGGEVQKTAEMMAKDFELVSRDMTKNVALVGEEIGKGWAGFNRFLDGVLNESSSGREGGVGAEDMTGQDPSHIQDLFGRCFPDLQEEDVVDAFPCTVMQKYRCYHNSATPERTFSFGGRLFITVQYVAFWAEVDESNFGSSQFPLVIAFKEVEKVQKGQANMLRLLMKSKASYIFTNFPRESDYKGALSLLEHMCDQAANAPTSAPVTTATPTESAVQAPQKPPPKVDDPLATETK